MELAQRVETTVRYDGPALVGHEMDVEALAPALLSLASLIQLANLEINGRDANRIRVVIDANTEQKCFQIKLKAILDAYEMAKDFFGSAEGASLKNLLEWLGIIGITPLSLFKVLKMLAKREAAKPDTTFNVGDNATIYNIAGDATFNGITPEVLKLLENPAIVEKAKGFFAPVEREGYSSVALIDANGVKAFEADKAEAKAIIALPLPVPASADDEDDGEPTSASGPAWVATSQFKGSAKWSLLWNGVKIDAKMPDEFLRQFQDNEILVVPNTKLTVEMTITPKIDKNGNALGPATFAVTAVTAIDLPLKAASQVSLFDEKSN